MTIEAIAALSGALPATQLSGAAATTTASSTTGGAFDALVHSFQEINSQMTSNQQAVESLAAGQADDLHRVMMNLESTSLAFDFALQVRNKVLDAYQELMRMQV
jgi:flagellar hook-basal body complex protein FliE